jgi:hypothetical protein
LKGIAKLNFALIQAILIKQGVLIFNAFDLTKILTENPSKLETNSQAFKSLLKSHEDLNRTRKMQENYSIALIEECWFRIISQFNLILTKLSGINDDDALPNLVSKKKFLFEDEPSSQKVRSFVAIFLQYFEIRKVADFLRFIIFTIRFGSDYVYFPLYELFLSSVIILKFEDEGNTEYYQRLFNSSEAKSSKVYSKKKWLELFNQYLKIWIFKTGN